MTEEQLLQIIAGGETLEAEFKGESVEPLNDYDLLGAVVCLANRHGEHPGFLLIGVEDTGDVTGARPRHEGGETNPTRLQSLIAARTRPSLACRVEMHEIDGNDVVVIEVPPSRTPVGTSDGRYMRRAWGGQGIPECRPFHFHEMQSWQADRGSLDYSSLVVPGATERDLDPLEFERYRRTIREARGRSDAALLDLPDMELARVLGAVDVGDDGGVTVRILGLLLFGKEEALREYLPSHEVAFQVLSGTRVEVNDFFRWPLLRLMDELLTRFRARNQEEEILIGLVRIGVPDYPEAAFREGIANALIHRDYTRLSAVHLQWHDDRIVISNPGGFPEGVRIDNLLITPPRPRNPLLADAFKRAGIVERTARGIDTIFFEQLRNGRPAPSYNLSSDTHVVLTLPGGEANLEFVRLLAEESQAGRPLRLEELLLLNHVWLERRLTIPEASTLIQRSEADARAALERLREVGLIEARGERQNRVYHLSASTYQRLGEEAAYVRQRGFEPLQQEQMVLQYISAHGRITRREVAELCRVTPREAGRLLKKLRDDQKIVLHGQRRWSWYSLAEDSQSDLS